MKNIIYHVGIQGPDEFFTASMRNMTLQTAPTALFGPLVAILTLHIGPCTQVVTCTVAYLGEIKAVCLGKGLRSTTQRGKGGCIWVTQTQMCVNLLNIVANREKLDGKPIKILLELWKQLKPET